MVLKKDRIPRFGALGSAGFASTPTPHGAVAASPSFLSSSPAKNRDGRDGRSRRKCREGCGPQRSEDPVPARLDGPAMTATVAGLAMKEGKGQAATTGEGQARAAGPLTTGNQSAQRATSKTTVGRSGEACSAERY